MADTSNIMQPSNEIWYTTANGKVASSNLSPTSNTYVDGRGVMTFDEPLTTIKKFGFEWSNFLVAIQLPESVTRIEQMAFHYCMRLQSITLPSTLTYLGSEVFSMDHDLKEVIYNGTLADWTSLEKEDDWAEGSDKDYLIYCLDGAITVEGKIIKPKMKIQKIKFQGKYVYPATIAAAVKDANFRKDDESAMTQGEINLYLADRLDNVDEPDLSNLVTKEELTPLQEAVLTHIVKGTLSTINGQSLEEGIDITIDTTLAKIVDKLPTTDIDSNKVYIVPTAVATNQTEFSEYIWTGSKWDQLGVWKASVDMADYLKTADADKKYLKLVNGTGTISINQNNGAMNNYGPNGQAYNAVRDCTGNSITGKDINAGSFGVKLDGTTAFSHKTYTSFNTTTGVTAGARNTAVLTFSGATGLRYAKNTGTAADVTEDMYRYVGIIDSPDAKQKVYSAAQVDAIVKTLQDQIDALKAQLS